MKINKQSAAGFIGMSNEVILWALEKEPYYELGKAIWKLAKYLAEEILPKNYSKRGKRL